MKNLTKITKIALVSVAIMALGTSVQAKSTKSLTCKLTKMQYVKSEKVQYYNKNEDFVVVFTKTKSTLKATAIKNGRKHGDTRVYKYAYKRKDGGRTYTRNVQSQKAYAGYDSKNNRYILTGPQYGKLANQFWENCK